MSRPLSRHLDRLRRDAGAPRAEAGRGAPAGDLAARVERLRRRPDRGAELASRLGGTWLHDGVLHVRTRLPVTGWSRPALAAMDLDPREVGSLRFVDTETTGLAGGAGTLVFLFGAGRIEGDDLVVDQLLLTRPGSEADFWAQAVETLGEAFTLVSYNGKSFDWPLVETRLCLSRIQRRPRPHRHLDLVHPVRRAFGGRWPDCRLAACEARLLGRPRRDDLGGEFAPWAYREFLAGRSLDPLVRIARHHHLDVSNLAALLPALGRVHADPASYGADSCALARFWLREGRLDRARALLEGCREAAAVHLLAEVHRRQERWSEAAALWSTLAEENDDLLAIEWLAKYHEHRCRAPDRALEYCRMLIHLEPDEPRHRHRLARVAAKAGVAA